MSLSTKVKLSAFVKSFYAAWLIVFVTFMQLYQGEFTRLYISLLIIAFFILIRILGSIISRITNKKDNFVSKLASQAMICVGFVWMVVNIPLVIPFLMGVYTAPPAVKMALCLLVGTTLVCFSLYYQYEYKRKRNEAYHSLSKAVHVSKAAENFMLKAQKKGIAISKCEKIMEKAENLIIIGQNCLKAEDFENTTLCAQSAIDMYREAVICLKTASH